MQLRPSTSHTDVEFLRQRVARMGRLATILTGFMLLVTMGIDLIEDGRVAWERPSKWWHVVSMVFLAGIWFINVRWKLTARSIRWVEGLGTIGATGAYTAMACQMPQAQSPHMTALMAATLLAVLRAIFVPSSPSQTFLIGLLQGIPLVTSVIFEIGRTPIESIQELSQSLDVDNSADVAWILGAVTAGWWIAALSLATAASQVIFGLRRRVKEITKLGQYTLVEKLGEGGMGQVYRANHAMLRRPTAVKLLVAPTLGAIDLRRFEREVQMTAALSHPHTITVFDYGRTPEGVFYYAMEYVNGATLDEVVRVDGPQDESRVVHVLKEVLGALAEAHDAGLVHRDIKPANIMLSKQGGRRDFTKVLDFGLVMAMVSEASEPQPGTTGIMGTPLYMAPESFEGSEHVDARTDLYSLGAVAYFLLTGSHLFTGQTMREVCEKHQRANPEAPSLRLNRPVSGDLEEFILTCLAKAPEKRFQNATSALAAVESLNVPLWRVSDAEAWWAEHGQEVQMVRKSALSDARKSTLELGFFDSQATITLGARESS